MISDNAMCFGCGACMNKCPKNAISMQKNADGFLIPIIDHDKCIGCNLCDKVCPTYEFEKTISSSEPKSFIGWQKDRDKSSSGGLFPLLAEKIINSGGLVCGAMMTNGILKHVVTDKLSDIEQMRGSKYFQSDMTEVYQKIKTELANNKFVLFVGTPCQVSGLKLFLGKDEDHLLTIDFVCHGVPSQDLFNKYAAELLQTNEPVSYLTFRDKRKGWHQSVVVINTENKQYAKEMEEDLFSKAFISNLILRKSCYSCPFAQYKRCSDITLADAWSIQYVNKKLDDNKGISLILINSHKGESYFNSIQEKMAFRRQIPKNWATMANPGLYTPVKEHMCRNRIFKEFNETKKVLPVLNKYTNRDNYIALLNFHFENNNYGAVLTAFALNKYLNDKGYLAFNIDYTPSWFQNKKQTTSFEEFRNNYLPRTFKCENLDDLKSLNYIFGTFIVGSDQVFRHRFTVGEEDVYYLQFVQKNRRKIAYAASFGVDYFEGNELETLLLGQSLKRFDSLSVREKGGVELIQNISGMKATHVLDPVFLLDKKEYVRLMKDTEPTEDTVAYILNDDVRQSVMEISKNIIDIRFGLSIEQWLEKIYRSKYVITDSFHCVCFCLIFQKQFCVLTKTESAVERIQSLFDLFQISRNKIMICKKNLIYKDIEENFVTPKDYDDLLNEWKQKSVKWLLNAITADLKKEDTSLTDAENLSCLKKQKKILQVKKIFSFGKRRKKIKSELKIIKKIIRFYKNN